MKHFQTEQQDGVLVVTFNAENKSVNTFNEETLNELEALVQDISNNHPKGLIFKSAKSTFVVGADIHEFVRLFERPLTDVENVVNRGQRIFNQIEDFPFPTVALINGSAMGGGFELALACDYRVASDTPGYQIGLPEVKLGLIPAWGGTTRLPRLIGADNAIELICGGKALSAKDALKNKMIDLVVAPDKMMDAAFNFMKFDYKKARSPKLGPIKLSWTEWMLTFRLAEGQVAEKAGKNYPAPLKALHVMRDGKKLNRDDALKFEVGAFVELFSGDTAKNLIRTFLLDQGAKATSKKLAGNNKINSVGVIGAGVMGRGIASLVAGKKISVKVFDENTSALEKCYNETKSYQMNKVGKGYITTEEAIDIVSKLHLSSNLDELMDCDVIVEAIYEDFNAKVDVYRKLGGFKGVLATNTSSLSVTELAEQLPVGQAEVCVHDQSVEAIDFGIKQDNFCGIHFFNPVAKMPLVEIVRGGNTSDETIAKAVAFANAIGKTPIVCKDCNGFVVNRLLFPYLAAFDALVNEGVDYQKIDKVMNDWGFPMGPATLSDLVGIDILYHAAKVMAEAYPERIKFNDNGPTATLYKSKSYGQKTNKGWYNWTLKGESYKKGNANWVAGNDMAADKIVERLMTPMVAEAKEMLNEGVVNSWDEINIGLIYGAGFPPFMGGLDKI